ETDVGPEPAGGRPSTAAGGAARDRDPHPGSAGALGGAGAAAAIYRRRGGSEVRGAATGGREAGRRARGHGPRDALRLVAAAGLAVPGGGSSAVSAGAAAGPLPIGQFSREADRRSHLRGLVVRPDELRVGRGICAGASHAAVRVSRPGE